MKEKSVEMTKKRSKLPKYDQKKREKRKKRTKEQNSMVFCKIKVFWLEVLEVHRKKCVFVFW